MFPAYPPDRLHRHHPRLCHLRCNRRQHDGVSRGGQHFDADPPPSRSTIPRRFTRCPECGHDKGWKLWCKAFTWECAGCGKQTSVTAGTVMHGSKLPLTIWFWAAYLMATHSNGIAAQQLQTQLGLGSYKSAWLLAAKLRRAMVAPEGVLILNGSP
jgi:hypothetical protein